SDEIGARLVDVASEWRALLQTERDEIAAAIEAERDIPNPFVFGNPVIEANSNILTARQDIVREIEESILGTNQAPTLLLHGQRRMGKTSILNQLPRLLGPNFLPIIIDFQNPAIGDHLASVLWYLARAITNAWQRRASKLEAVLLPTGKGPNDLAATFNDELQRRSASLHLPDEKSLKSDPFIVFDEWLDQAEWALPADMRVLLCMDEYEHLQSKLMDNQRGLFLDALRHWIQHRQQLVLMFTGSHTFEELGPEWTDRFISAKRVKVSYLNRHEVHLLLTEPAPDFTMTYAPRSLETLQNETNGQPFLTQAVASELVQFLNQEHRKLATPDDVEDAINRALTSAGEYFANVWSSLPGTGKEIMCALASGQTVNQLAGAFAWLRDHDLLYPDGNFSVPMFKRWLKTTQL